MKLIYFVIFIAFIVFACQSVPPAVNNTETSLPSKTPVTALKATQPPTPTIIPTSTISPLSMEQEAASICEGTFSATVQSGNFDMPYLEMWKTEWDNAPTWKVSNSIPHLFALSKDSVKTIICTSNSRRQVGIYTDGSAAFQITQNVRIVSWPDGTVIGSKTFEGEPPPQEKTGLGSGYGSYPTEVRPWIFDQLGEINDPDFLFLPNEENGSAVALSPDGSLIALGVSGNNGSSKIMLLNIQNLQTISSWNVDVEKVNNLTFSPDGTTLVSTGSDSNIFLWDTKTGDEIGMVTLPSAASLIKYSPDGKFIAASTTTDLYLIDLASKQISISYPKTGVTFSFSPNGEIIYTDQGSIETMTGNLIHQFYDYTKLIPTISPSGDVSFDTGLPDFISNFTLSPGGLYGISYSFSSSTDGITTDIVYTLSAIDINTWKQVMAIPFTGTSFDMLGFSPDGKYFAVGIGSEIWLLDTQTWHVTKKFIGHTGRIHDFSFSPDGKKLVSLSIDNTIRVWSFEN